MQQQVLLLEESKSQYQDNQSSLLDCQSVSIIQTPKQQRRSSGDRSSQVLSQAANSGAVLEEDKDQRNGDKDIQGKLKLLDADWQAKRRGHRSGRPHKNPQNNDESNDPESNQRSLAENYRSHKLKFSGIQVRLNQCSKVTQRMYQEVEAAKNSTCCISGTTPCNTAKSRDNRQIRTKKPDPVTSSSCLIF